MERDLILAFDLGTSGLKASLVDRQGTMLASEKAAYATYHTSDGISEQDPEDWWQGICTAMKAMGEKHPTELSRVAAMGVSGHMLGCIPVDITGAPLYRAMIHSDSRAQEEYEWIRDHVGADTVYRMSGNVLDARSSLSKLLWFARKRPDIYRKAAKFLQSKDYITAKLTGNIDTTDMSDGSHGSLIDCTARRYDSALYTTLGIAMEKLPTLHAGVDIVGILQEDPAAALGLIPGIPVIAGGGDGACADMGAGNVNVGDTYCSLGTTAWISRVTEYPYLDPERRTFNIMSLDGVHACMFGTMQSAGGAVKWAQDLLGETDLASVNEMAAAVPAGSGGLLFLPYLDGERSPIFDPKASGVYFGMSLSHGREHFFRATFEGVALALRTIFDVFREQGDCAALRIIGGGAKSDLWRQILADVLHLPIRRINTSADDATSLGVAAAAGTAVGLYRDLKEATAHIAAAGEDVPGNDGAVYEAIYPVFRDLYPAAADFMHRLKDAAGGK